MADTSASSGFPRNCPSCHSAYKADWALCVHCGYDRHKGYRVDTETGNRLPPLLPAVAGTARASQVRRTRITWLLAGLVLAVIALAIGILASVMNAPTPEAQFKAIADRKRAQVSQVLTSKGASLSSYEATVTPETNSKEKAEFPYVARIEFHYPATEPEGKSPLLHGLTAKYRYSQNQKRWVYQGCEQSIGERAPVIGEPAVFIPFAELQAAFER